MIPLFRKDFPSRKADLSEALDETVHRFVEKPGPIVDVRARVFPYVDEIAVNLDGAIIDLSPPPLANPEGETGRAFEAAAVNLKGRRVSVASVPLDVRMHMRDAIFDWGYEANGDAVLIPRTARDGQVVISAAQLLLEEAIIRIVGAKARLYGVDLEKVRLFMRARGGRSIAADIQVQAKKFFARAKIDIYAQLDISDDFVVRISQLKCKGDGKLGSFACATLQPMFQSVMEKSFPLKSLPLLSDLKVRDVRVAVGDAVDLTIDFGSV
ncbi:MAG TPA: hypothetical protein VH170_03945 [Chthoniobacterales bacterium]|jgi:hypothetical protein|nr:hypothetical protein [Chthoniobacterales bacterium]